MAGRNSPESWEPWDQVRGEPVERPERHGVGGGLDVPDHDRVRPWPRWVLKLALAMAAVLAAAGLIWTATALGARQSIAFIGCALLLAGWLRLRSASTPPTPLMVKAQREEWARHGTRRPADAELRESIRGFNLLVGALLLALGATALIVAVWPP